MPTYQGVHNRAETLTRMELVRPSMLETSARMSRPLWKAPGAGFSSTAS